MRRLALSAAKPNGQRPRVGLRTSAHIWSPPVLQDSVRTLTGTGLLPYIRPVDEEFACSSGLDEIGAYRPNHPSGLQQPLGLTGFQYAGLTCGVINVHIVFAIVGRSTSFALLHATTLFRPRPGDTPSHCATPPSPCAPVCWPTPRRPCWCRAAHGCG